MTHTHTTPPHVAWLHPHVAGLMEAGHLALSGDLAENLKALAAHGWQPAESWTGDCLLDIRTGEVLVEWESATD